MNKIVVIVIVLIICFILFIVFYKPFGWIPNGKDLKNYLKRSSVIKNRRFVNSSLGDSYTDLYSSKTTGKGVKPRDKFPVESFSYISKYNRDDVLVTWFGHSTVLIQMSGFNILVDPMFSNIASPFFIGPKRFSDLPCNIDLLPNIDIVVITHDHYDHLDYRSIKKLNKKTSKFIVPLGIDKDLEKFGVESNKIVNMSWWEDFNFNGLTVICAPARHYSVRFVIDYGKALYSSFIFKNSYNTVFISGDTGYGNHFNEIGNKYNIDFALLDSGQYNVKWHGSHMFPEEAVRASSDLHSKLSMPIHWGSFTLSKHSFDDPVNRFVIEVKEKSINYIVPKIGQTVNIKEYKNYQDEWWKKMK